MTTFLLLVIAITCLFIAVILWRIYEFIGAKNYKGTIYQELEKLSSNFFDFYGDWIDKNKGN